MKRASGNAGSGWTVVLAVLIALCLLGATTSAATHLHTEAARSTPEAHCSLCALATTLAATVVLLVLLLLAEERVDAAPVLLRRYEHTAFRAATIRPPPHISKP